MLAYKQICSFALYSKYFIIQQTYIEDMYYRRINYREKHQQLLENITKKDAQIIGGSLFPYTGAYYIINCNSEDVIKKFINKDPYTQHNLACTTYYQIEPDNDNFDQLANQLDYK